MPRLLTVGAILVPEDLVSYRSQSGRMNVLGLSSRVFYPLFAEKGKWLSEMRYRASSPFAEESTFLEVSSKVVFVRDWEAGMFQWSSLVEITHHLRPRTEASEWMLHVTEACHVGAQHKEGKQGKANPIFVWVPSKGANTSSS